MKDETQESGTPQWAEELARHLVGTGLARNIRDLAQLTVPKAEHERVLAELARVREALRMCHKPLAETSQTGTTIALGEPT